MAKKPDILPYRIFVGNRPIEDLNQEELEAFKNRVVNRMGNAMNDYFSCHPEEYKKVKDISEKTMPA